ncbi:MAG: 6-bladed beta-propeller [Bacteroidota bacterium]
MIRGKKLLLCLAFAMAVACPAFAQRTVQTDTSHYQTLRIDPGNAMGGNASDFFEEINYIPLETTPESLYGSIAQLEVVDDYFIIRDDGTRAILIFKKSGKFHAKIKSASVFSVNRWTKQIVVTNAARNGNAFYDFDGKYIKTVNYSKQPKERFFYLSDVFFIGPDKMIMYNSSQGFDTTDVINYKPYSRSNFKFITTKDDTKTVDAVGMPYKKEDVTLEGYSTDGIGPMSYYGNDTTFYYSKEFARGIYTVTPNTIKLDYKFMFPLNNSLPADFATNPVYNFKRSEYLQRNREVIFSVNNVYRVGSNLLFEASAQSSNLEDNLIYNLKTGRLIAFKRISTDASSFYLPLYMPGPTAYFDFKGITACDGQNIYTSASSLAMFRAYQENEDKNIKYNGVLTDYFKNRNKKDNEVIIQLKLKPNL